MYRLLIHSARQVVQVAAQRETCLRGRTQMNSLAVLEQKEPDGDGVSIVVNRDGLIEAIGFDSEIAKQYGGAANFDQVLNAAGKSIVPGLVDGHTHAVWLGDRVNEFAMKLAGASYLEVHEAGGGIHFTVRHVRAATEDQLYAAFKQYAKRMLSAGTTLLECKTGYGLDYETELKMLKVLERARTDPDIHLDISATYCAAHAVPKDSTADKATVDIVDVQLPDIKRLIDAGELHIDNIDVFCERGVFDVEQTRRILEAGQQIGLAANFHGEELSCLHSAEMGAEINARAISHLEELSDDGMKAMADKGVAAVLLPTTAYILRLQPPRARDMIDSDVIVALGSDFNPNAHCLAMPIVMHLACVLMRLSMPEALAAATINAAASLGKSSTHGSIEVGKLADIVIINAPRWEHLIYQLGGHHDVISCVIKRGKLVHTSSDNLTDT